MSDSYRIDSHKLIYHPERVALWDKCYDNWEEAKSVYPIYVEISPIGLCNHRCSFCGLDFMGYQNVKINYDTLKNTLIEMQQLGIKSIMFAGEGEPLLYKELTDILDLCSSVNIDTSLTTNLVPLKESSAEALVRNCKWIKVSINAGNSEVYSKIHGTKPEDFDKALNNMSLLSRIKKDKGYTCTLGAQALLLPENQETLVELACVTQEAGFDYIVIKPYSQHLSSITDQYKNVDYSMFIQLEKELKRFNTKDFKVIFRSKTMEKTLEEDFPYQKCYSTPFFWAYISSDGSLYGCSCFLGHDEFCYGNIHKNSFKEIWQGERRKENYEHIKTEMDIKNCRKNCRMDEINRYLWELKHPGSHVNFI